MVMQRPPATMGLADVIAAAWTACVRHWRSLLLTALPGALLTALLSYALLKAAPTITGSEEVTQAELQSALAGALPVLLPLLLVQLFTHLALVHAGLAILRAEPVHTGAALRAGGRALLSVLVTGLALFLLFVAGTTLLVIILLPPVGFVVLGMLIISPWSRRAVMRVARWFLYGWYAVVGWLLAPQVVVDERRGFSAAVVRSAVLTRGQSFRVLGIGLAVLAVSFLPGFVVGQFGRSDGGIIAASAVAFLLQAPFLALGHTQLYLDIRMRQGVPARPPLPQEHEPL